MRTQSKLLPCALPTCLSLFIAAAPLPAQDPHLPQVDALFAAIEGKQLPGAAVLAVRDGKLIHRAAYGLANVELGVPNRPETIFRIASLSKQFTAVAILQLVERGQLSLDDRLARFYPDFPDAGKITIYHLLTHTAGVPDFISFDEALKTPLQSPPGERLNYSNTGYDILGRIIERVSGKSYADFLAENMFGPLKMSHSGAALDRRLLPGRAAGYQPDGKGGFTNVDYSAPAGNPAGGGLYSSVDDMRLWDQALYPGGLLKPETLALAFRPVRLNSGREAGYACGWMLRTHRALREVGHGGDIDGYNAYIARYPDQHFTVIVLANMTMRPPGPVPTADELAHRIAEIALAGEMGPVQPPPDVAVPAAILDQYVGKYKLEAPPIILQNAGDSFTFTREGNRLVAQAGPVKLPLFAESQDTFYSQQAPAKITFVRDSAGKVTEFILILAGVREYRAPRIE